MLVSYYQYLSHDSVSYRTISLNGCFRYELYNQWFVAVTIILNVVLFLEICRSCCEAGMEPFAFDMLPTADSYKLMLSKSPIIYAHQVKRFISPATANLWFFFFVSSLPIVVICIFIFHCLVCVWIGNKISEQGEYEQ